MGNGDTVAIAAAPPPVATADLSPSPTHSGEPATLPAPTGDPLQLAAALEPVASQKQSNPVAVPDALRPEPAKGVPSSSSATEPADGTPKGDERQAQPTLAQASQVERKSVPSHDSNPPTIDSESTKEELFPSKGALSTNQEVEKAINDTTGHANKPKAAASVPLSDKPIPSRSEPQTPAKPSGESSGTLGGRRPFQELRALRHILRRQCP